jgi:hypothetical protein
VLKHATNLIHKRCTQANMNIIIIGNGFDLAHNLKTSYGDFINYLFLQSEKNNKKNKELFTIVKNSITTENYLFKINNKDYNISLKNLFFGKLLKEYSEKKWSDIESLYFEELKKTENIYELNKEFDIIKNKLSEYLSTIETNTIITSFNNFFNKLKESKSLFLNFNYTDNFEKNYFEKNIKPYKNQKLINIHGELFSNENPIIFGYSATENEKAELLQKNINDYLINIKSYSYKRKPIENEISSSLNISSGEQLNVFILGHSCSISDGNILNEIFSNEKNTSINIVYYDNFENYREQLININRIIGSNVNYNKINNYESSMKFLNINSTKNENDDFNNKTLNLDLKDRQIIF